MSSRKRRLAVMTAAAIVSSGVGLASADVTIVDLEMPTLDRWNYPFNQTPGSRPTAPVFGAFVEDGLHPDFDNRDGQFHVGFATDELVEPKLGPSSYNIITAHVTMMVATDKAFKYDPTFNIWQSYLPPDHPEYEPDPTPGRPMELFGVGFRHGFDALTYEEDTPYSPKGPFGKGHRTTYAMDFDEHGEARDVSNNMDEEFDPFPFAIGKTDAVEPGELVPLNTTFTFELDIEDPYVRQYLQESLDLGIVHFMVASLFPASEDQEGSYPEYYTKDNILVPGVADASGLYLEVEIIESPLGDLNGDGMVGVADLLILISEWGPCDEPDDCPADLNDDGVVDVTDLLILIGNWG